MRSVVSKTSHRISHYVPQEYLRPFAPPSQPDQVWRMDKLNGESKLLPIKNVGMEKDFYTGRYEDWLSLKVEGPAWGPRNELLRHEQIDLDGRRKLAILLYSMMVRGPRTRRILVEESIPRLAPEVALRLTVGDKTSGEIIRMLHSLPVSDRVVALLSDMTWRVVTIKERGHERFITSDNPVFIDYGYGLKRPFGELSFPLSSRTALHARWQGQPGKLLFDECPSSTVKEFNRRSVLESVQYLFSDSESKWVLKVRKHRSPLHRLSWN